MNDLLDHRRELHRIGAGSDDERAASVGLLRIGEIHIGLSFLIETHMFHIAYDSNDFVGSLSVPLDKKRLPDWIHVGELLTCQRLAYHGHLRRTLAVALVQQTA